MQLLQHMFKTFMEYIENSFCNLISVEFVVRPIDLRLKWHILNLSFLFMQGENFVPGSGTSGTFSGVLEMSIYATLSCNLRVRDRVPGLCGTTLNQCLSTVAHIITCVPISLIFPPSRDLSVSISPSCGIVASHSSDRKSTRLNSSHALTSRMPSSA